MITPGSTILAIDGDWFDPRLSRRALRATSDLLRVVKERHFTLRQKHRYGAIRKDLPLYSLKPEKVAGYLGDAGFSDIRIEPMKDLFSSA